NYLIGGVEPEPMGDQNATAAPSGTFETADGPLNIAANQQAQFETLCRLVGRPDLPDDPRFAEREARKTHRRALNQELNQALRAKTALEWEELLSEAGVPAARILTVPQALALDQLTRRGFLTEVPLAGAGGRPVTVTGNGVVVDGVPLRPRGSAPRLGEHNSEIEEAS
ncbi:CoA transferase, partial [Nonomuraea sp. NPDC004297]